MSSIKFRSLKQPWATLLVHGRKWIEVRRWPTARRGRLLIHAAKVADPSSEAWARVPDELKEATELRGGIIGSVEITGCLNYTSLDTFVADRHLHLNEPSWFLPSGLFGFVMTSAKLLPFCPLPGNVRMFQVPAVRSR
ncbi:MAG: ASCH domain-containing protein [Gemmataceae bacterium]